jgi:hypothetical protein
MMLLVLLLAPGGCGSGEDKCSPYQICGPKEVCVDNDGKEVDLVPASNTLRCCPATCKTPAADSGTDVSVVPDVSIDSAKPDMLTPDQALDQKLDQKLDQAWLDQSIPDKSALDHATPDQTMLDVTHDVMHDSFPDGVLQG